MNEHPTNHTWSYELDEAATRAAARRVSRADRRLHLVLFGAIGAMIFGPVGLGAVRGVTGGLLGLSVGLTLGLLLARKVVREREVALSESLRTQEDLRQRSIRADAAGIEAAIGAKRTLIPWDRVARIETQGALLVVVGDQGTDLAWAPAALRSSLQRGSAVSEPRPSAPAPFTARWTPGRAEVHALGSANDKAITRPVVGLAVVGMLLLALGIAEGATARTVAGLALAWLGVDLLLLSTLPVWLPRLWRLVVRPPVQHEMVLHARPEGLETRSRGIVEHIGWPWLSELRETDTHLLAQDPANAWYVVPKSACNDPAGLADLLRAKVQPRPAPPPEQPAPAVERAPPAPPSDNPFAPPGS